MGLDMYLYGVKVEFEKHDYDIGEQRTSIEIGYWRKANAIHKWFVDNIQDGVDDCDIYRLDKNDLRTLKDICQEILDNKEKAPLLLPTQSGFFFGSTDYDEYYFKDLKETIEICDWALNHDFNYFEYQSSW